MEAQERADRGGLAVWPENWRAVEVFVLLASQWRVVVSAASTHWQGLRYEAVESVMRLACVPRKERADVFRQLRVMEIAARDVLNAKR
ncbi:MAG: DUF1799 domain-containing protein [Gemmatimonadaceae bacterium]|nr:DUF1799 domain-containing protein [Gemmatimonadaceae bacterium]